MKKRFTEVQIVAFLRETHAGIPVKELCRKHGFSDASYYLWWSKFGGMSVPDDKRLKELEIENARFKKLLAESLLENEVPREVLRRASCIDGPGARSMAMLAADQILALLDLRKANGFTDSFELVLRKPAE